MANNGGINIDITSLTTDDNGVAAAIYVSAQHRGAVKRAPAAAAVATIAVPL